MKSYLAVIFLVSLLQFIAAFIPNGISTIDLLILYPLFSDINETSNLVDFVCNYYQRNDDTDIDTATKHQLLQLNFIFLIDVNNEDRIDYRIQNCSNAQYNILLITQLFRVDVYGNVDNEELIKQVITVQNTCFVYFVLLLNKYDIIIMNHNNHHNSFGYIYRFIELLPSLPPIIMLPNDRIIDQSPLSSRHLSALGILCQQLNMTAACNHTISKVHADDSIYSHSHHEVDRSTLISDASDGSCRIYNDKYVFCNTNNNNNNNNTNDFRTNYLGLSSTASSYLSALAQRARLRLNGPSSILPRSAEFGYIDQNGDLNATGKGRDDDFSRECMDRKEELFGIGGLKVISNIEIPTAGFHVDDGHWHDDRDDDDDELKLLLCLTFTYQPNEDYIQGILDTWGKECDGYLAFSNHSNEDLSIIKVNSTPIPETYKNMWIKTVEMVHSIVSSDLINQYEYFLFGGDDLYVVVPNLRSFLSVHKIRKLSNNGKNPLLIGRIIAQNIYLSFASGGSGYILNRSAVRLLSDILHLPSSPCLPTLLTSMEDVMVAHCLKLAGILPLNYYEIFDSAAAAAAASDDIIIDSDGSSIDIDMENGYQVSARSPIIEDLNDDGTGWRGYDGKEIFHPITPSEAYTKTEELQWFVHRAFRYNEGDDCCSKYSVSFQSIATSFKMRCLHHLIHTYR